MTEIWPCPKRRGVLIDWRIRAKGRPTLNPALESTERRDATAALIVFVVAYAAAIPFMDATLVHGSIVTTWHGADIAYFANMLVAAVLYGGYRMFSARAA